MKSESKLPKWAQGRLQNLRRDLDYTRERLKEAVGPGVPDSDTRLQVMDDRGFLTDRGLRSGSTVRFVLKGRRDLLSEFWVSVRTDPRGVVINGQSSFLVTPESSNLIVITERP